MNRNKDIDNLRGLAMLAMIAIHACSYFLKDKTVFFIWDSLQWAVPMFLFCSFYLYYHNSKTVTKNSFWSYLIKRLNRLLVPYFKFLLIYFFLLYFFQRNSFNIKNISANIFLYGGLDFNWLPLLFLYFSFIMPLVNILRKRKIWFYLLEIISFLSSLLFIFYLPFSYRTTMWLPWSLMIFFTLFFIKNENNWKKNWLLAGISLGIYFGLRFLEVKIGHNLSQYGNKYPPTLYHLSYGIFWSIILLWLAKKNVFTFLNFDKLLYFLSVNSYTLFFIHLLVIFIFTWTKIHFVNWFAFFLTIFGISSAIVLLPKASQNVFGWLKNRS